ncbi:MAG TPA: hypothetical protein VGL61_05885 [Kofleriaceae bacterium]|jgi:RNA polymerase-binding transcription factor DksA
MNGVRPLRYLSRWVTPRALRIQTGTTTCESCGAPSLGRLCAECREKAEPHHDNDPYDIVGGEGGGWS